MSVSSEFVIHCKNELQVKEIENFPAKLSGNGQDYAISEEMKVQGNKVLFSDCFCMDDFENVLPELCKFLGETQQG
ncbi:hypothetical protein [Butyrivibrio sp. LC3010]|uniref:hypothetical protein n=1 Tax=Butyrivibrio sp. LC3010 TaxID=1280680 RepID=UPI00047A3987|nr:hypothetical protein [Butyrivibrio sp. LC3010]